jgi:hypothetical protein
MTRLICILAFSLITGCFFFDEDDTGDNEEGYSYSFKNQVAQGKINGENWVFLAGTASESSYAENQLLIQLFEVSPQGDSCSGFNKSKYEVSFRVSNVPGIYKLGFGSQVSFTGNKVTSLGAIEIIKFDDIKKTVSGRVDAFAGDSCKVNGSFEVRYCN